MGEVIVYISEERDIEALCQFSTWVALSSKSQLRIFTHSMTKEYHELHLPCGVPPEIKCPLIKLTIRSVQNCILRQMGESTRMNLSKEECSQSESPLDLTLQSLEKPLNCPEQLKADLKLNPSDLLVMAWEGAGSKIQETADLLHRLPCGFITIDCRSFASGSLQKVVLAISGGKDAPSLLPWVVSLTPRTRINLELVYVISGEEETETMGQQIFKKLLSPLGIKDLRTAETELGIHCRTLSSTDPATALASRAEESPGTLILLGYSRQTSLQRVMFGKINDELKKKLKTAEYGIIRARKTWKQILLDRFELLCNISVPQLNRQERIHVYESMNINSRIGFDFVLQMSLASSIASLGLMSNSAAVVIGAMLVAPLMTPILACGLALIQHNSILFKSAAKSLGIGFLMAIFIGWGFGLMSLDNEITHEMTARGRPGVPDLIVAVLSGVAAAYCQGRQQLSAALAGVAIAAALVPPLATIGLCLCFGSFSNSFGALILFITNVLAIILGSIIAFFAVGIRSQKKRRWASQVTSGVLLGLLSLMIALNYDRIGDLFKKKLPGKNTVANTIHEKLALPQITLKSLTVQKNDDRHLLTLDIESPRTLSKTERQLLKSAMEKLYQLKLNLKIRTILISID